MAESVFRSYSEFYAFYLSEHAKPLTRRLHFVGTSLALACLFFALIKLHWLYLLLAPAFGYGIAWLSHYLVEKNRPASFKHPFYSFVSDWRMWWEMLTGKLAF